MKIVNYIIWIYTTTPDEFSNTILIAIVIILQNDLLQNQTEKYG